MAQSFDLAEICHVELGLLANRPCLKSVEDGSWVWRFANGFTGRANSLQCHNLGDDADFELRLESHWARSREFGIAPQFRVTPLTPAVVSKYLQSQNFVRHGNTQVMILSEAKTKDFISPISKITQNGVGDEAWQRDILRLENIVENDAKTFVQLLNRLPAKSVGLRLVDSGGKVIGAAYASCCDGLGSIFALIVDPKHRGAGHGRALMTHLQNWLIHNGAQKIALQVVADNRAALALYHSLGFEEAYKYYYLAGIK